MSIAHLYHPGIDEIRPLMAKAIAKAPHLRQRMERAEAILLNHDLHWRTDDWHAYSQARDLTTYTVSLNGCTCPDFIHARGNLWRGRPACKHRIALMMYRELLLNRMNPMIAGPHTGTYLRRVHKLGEPIILYKTDSPTLIGGRFNGVDLRIGFEYNGQRQRRQFRTAQDMAQFAAWLYEVAEVEPQAINREPFAIAIGYDQWPVSGHLHAAELAEAVDAEMLPFEQWVELYPQS